jgi:hypothetical protein
VIIALTPEHHTTMDVQCRASAVAVGAAVFNARVAAAAQGLLGSVEFHEADGAVLEATLSLDIGDDPTLAGLYGAMLQRETNRVTGKPTVIPDTAVAALMSAVEREGAQLQMVLARDDIRRAADILAQADRIRYLTPRLHAEMFSELRFPGDPSLDSGIDVQSLQLDPADLVKLDVLRRPEVMSHLARWQAGAALGEGTRHHVNSSAGLGIVSVSGHYLTDYARGGSAVEALWIIAQQLGLAVQPVSPVFLYAHNTTDLERLSPHFKDSLGALQAEFRTLARTKGAESQVLVLRFADASPTSVRSRRRSLEADHLLASQVNLE